MNRYRMIEIVERVIESYVEEVDYEDVDTNVLAENVVQALERAGVGATDEGLRGPGVGVRPWPGLAPGVCSRARSRPGCGRTPLPRNGPLDRGREAPAPFIERVLSCTTMHRTAASRSPAGAAYIGRWRS
ncbi:hypothetical protein GCM10010502_64090 [Kitasatospora aureofaciens]|uniref:Uncharacterized protein n=1 Tax=Kitasatospora aureofaciens TaxID=1894 RepID=A0A8H9LU03_KITAU|nr:hypothetical protein GCM10010502_64090 [Kitasatospora aureofaciens]